MLSVRVCARACVSAYRHIFKLTLCVHFVFFLTELPPSMISLYFGQGDKVHVKFDQQQHGGGRLAMTLQRVNNSHLLVVMLKMENIQRLEVNRDKRDGEAGFNESLMQTASLSSG